MSVKSSVEGIRAKLPVWSRGKMEGHRLRVARLQRIGSRPLGGGLGRRALGARWLCKGSLNVHSQKLGRRKVSDAEWLVATS